MQLPHRYTDHLPRWLSPDEQAIYVQLYRLSWGWGRDVCFISNPKLAERSGVPETSMRRAVKKLIGKGLIEKTDRRFGGTEQGIEYRVFNLDRLAKQDRASNVDSLSTGAPNKERIKENSKADASRCPDCMGTGFYYPEGTAKGVKRCEHRKLR
jgi:DNA-binding Lrp family transcriptional regulator